MPNESVLSQNSKDVLRRCFRAVWTDQDDVFIQHHQLTYMSCFVPLNKKRHLSTNTRLEERGERWRRRQISKGEKRFDAASSDVLIMLFGIECHCTCCGAQCIDHKFLVFLCHDEHRWCLVSSSISLEIAQIILVQSNTFQWNRWCRHDVLIGWREKKCLMLLGRRLLIPTFSSCQPVVKSKSIKVSPAVIHRLLITITGEPDDFQHKPFVCSRRKSVWISNSELLEREHCADQVKDDECTFTKTDPRFTRPLAWTIEGDCSALKCHHEGIDLLH